MANAIGATAFIPTFTADGYQGVGGDRLLTFSAGDPPSDGSLGLAFVILDIPGISFEAGDFGAPTQRLIVYSNTSVGKASVTGGGTFEYAVVGNWSFVEFANVAG